MALLFDSWLVELFAVLASLFAAFYFFLSHRFQYWNDRNIPYVEPSFPFGNVANMALQKKSIGENMEELYYQLEGYKYGGFFQMHRPGIIVRDPEMVKSCLVKDFAHFHDHGFYFDEESDPLSGHLFSLEGTKWRHMRQKLTPTFTSGKMKMMFPTILDCADELTKHVAPLAERRETIEVKDVLAKFSTDVIASCAFGITTNSLKNPDSEFRHMGRRVFETNVTSSLRDMLFFLMPKVAALFKVASMPRDVSDFFLKIVKEMVDQREKFNIVRKDFLQLLIGIKNKKSIDDDPIVTPRDDHVNGDVGVEKNMFDVRGMTIEELAAQSFVFFVAGFETSSTTMSFCLHELALNETVQERLREEIDDALAKCDGRLSYEAVHKMTYLDMVISETLRKYPPVPVLMRSCTKEYKLPDSDVTMEKGTWLMIPALGLHRDPQYYPKPDEFDPERFTEEAKSKRHHYVYLPFGEGPRICIGSRFGLMQTKIGLISIIGNYKVKVCPKQTIVPLVIDTKSFIMAAKGGIPLQITNRQ